ncbi:MAG: SPOR domain-containing protein [Desulfotalea sp.]
MRVKIEAISDHQLKKDSRGRINYPDINKGVFFVQIGAFANKNNAYRLANKFKKYGHKAKVTINKNGKRTLYRVHIYAGHSLKKSKAFERSLEKQGYKGAFTIAK